LRAAKNIPWLILAIVALAAFLRFFNLGSESIWLDEAISVHAAETSLVSIVQKSISADVHPPLYNLLLHFWVLIFGQSEAAVRSLSACFGIISVLLLYKVGRALFDRKVGLIASILMAISAFTISYSQEARAYSLLLLLTLISFLILIKILKANKPGKIHLFLYTLTNILLCYTHIFGLFVVGAQVLYFLLFRHRYAKARLAFWGTQAVTLVGFSPWVYVLVTKTFQDSIQTLNWIPEPSFQIVARSLGSLSGAGYLWLPLGVLLMLALLFLCLVGMFYSPKARQRASRTLPESIKPVSLTTSLMEPRTALLLIWFFFPLIISLILSFAIRPIFVSRYLIEITPALYLLAARGIDNIDSSVNYRTVEKNAATFALIGLVCLISIPGLYNYYAHPHKGQWRDATNFIEQESRASDIFVIYPDYDQLPLDYYRKGGTEITVISSEAIENGEPLTSKERLWLVLSDYESPEAASIKDDLVARYGSDSLIMQKEFFHVAVYLFSIKGS
jgi:uncharacterized membrane protein